MGRNEALFSIGFFSFFFQWAWPKNEFKNRAGRQPNALKLVFRLSGELYVRS